MLIKNKYTDHHARNEEWEDTYAHYKRLTSVETVGTESQILTKLNAKICEEIVREWSDI